MHLWRPTNCHMADLLSTSGACFNQNFSSLVILSPLPYPLRPCCPPFLPIYPHPPPPPTPFPYLLRELLSQLVRPAPGRHDELRRRLCACGLAVHHKLQRVEALIVVLRLGADAGEQHHVAAAL